MCVDGEIGYKWLVEILPGFVRIHPSAVVSKKSTVIHISIIYCMLSCRYSLLLLILFLFLSFYPRAGDYPSCTLSLSLSLFFRQLSGNSIAFCALLLLLPLLSHHHHHHCHLTTTNSTITTIQSIHIYFGHTILSPYPIVNSIFEKSLNRDAQTTLYPT